MSENIVSSIECSDEKIDLLKAADGNESESSFQSISVSNVSPKSEDENSEDYETPEPENVASSESSSVSGDSQLPPERASGDGEELGDRKDKKSQPDVDKKDPQYIPKKGKFYEHDDRTLDEGEEPKGVEEKKPGVRRSEKESRWGHDMYDESQQTPKSKEELIEQYGYDIRSEEGPPKARRRRRYGRGPNKYTRSWEEEEAYTKGPGSGGGGRGVGGRLSRHNPRNQQQPVEEFPPLPQKIPSQSPPAGEPRRGEEVPPPPAAQPPPPPAAAPLSHPPPPSSLPPPLPHPPPSVAHPPPQPSRLQKRLDDIRTGATPSKPFSHHKPGSGGPNVRSQHFHQTPSKAAEDIAALSQQFTNAVINVDNKPLPTANQIKNRMELIEGIVLEVKKEAGVVLGKPGVQVKISQPKNEEVDKPPQTSRNSLRQVLADHDKELKSKRYSTQRRITQSQNAGGTIEVTLPPGQTVTGAGGTVGPARVYHYIQPEAIYPHGGVVEAGPGGPSPVLRGFDPHQPPPPFPGGDSPPPAALVAFIPPPAGVPPVAAPPPIYYPPAPQPPPPPTAYLSHPPPPPVQVGGGSGPEVYQGITYYSPQSQVCRPAQVTRRVKLAIPIVPPPPPSNADSTEAQP